MKEQIIASETVLFDVAKLKGYDKNPRKGNVDAIAESLKTNSQYRPIVVQKSSNKILAGNHTWRAAKSLGWKKIAVVFVDVDDEGAKRIVLADNRTNDLATYDDEILAELLRDLGSGVGTGYSDDDMKAIFEAVSADAEDVIMASNDAGERTLMQDDELAIAPTGLGGESASDSDDNSFGYEYDDEDEKSDIEAQKEDLTGVYTLKDEMVFPSTTFWEIPYLREDMMIEELPPNLKTWAGSATRDDDHDGYWLYNWGIDSTSGMKDLSKIMLAFYTWDEYFDNWWHDPARHMSKVLNAKIKYAITPNYTPNDIPRTLSLLQLYKSRWVGRYLQEIGVKVMPDLQIREEDEFLELASKTYPKRLPWASIQTQNLVGTTRTGQGITEEEAKVHLNWTLKSVRSANPENLLIYAHPNQHERMTEIFGEERNVVCMPTRLYLLSKRVKANKADAGRL